LGREQNIIHSQRYHPSRLYITICRFCYPPLPLSFPVISSPLFSHPFLTPANKVTDKLSTDLTGDKNINAIQGGIAEGVGGTLSSGGILGGVGDLSSKEGVNRAERGDPGLDPKELEKLGKKKEQPKGWTETLSGGYIGGSK